MKTVTVDSNPLLASASRDVNPVLAAFLHVVHRLVGGLEQALGRGGHVGEGRDPHRHGQMNVEPVALEEPVRVDALADTFPDGGGPFAPGVREDQRKFVPAEA